MPAALTGRDPEKILGDLIDDLEDRAPKTGPDRVMKGLLCSLSCQAALKAGQDLTPEEMDRLLTDLSQTRLSTHCPHGRPLIFHLHLRDLDRKFKRA